MDIFFLSPAYFLITEVKYISGILEFDPDCDQLIWTQNNIEKALPDPVNQVNHQKFQFEAWLKSNKCQVPPIETLVVVANSSSIIKFKSGDRHYRNKVIRGASLLKKMTSFEKLYNENVMTAKEIRRLSNLLIKRHTPADQNVLEKFNINPANVLTGVCCPRCSFIPMKRIYSTWKCPNCSNISKDAHLLALQDYALLFQTSITNKQLRTFLHLSSAKVANQILTTLNLQTTGVNKGRVYHLPTED